LVEVIIESLADWFKITVGLAVPLLLLSAIIETTLTPILLQKFLLQLFAPGSP
jgi:uncharacterized membrane protein SpoIIM required for sporulation